MKRLHKTHPDDYEREQFTTPKGVVVDCDRAKWGNWRAYLNAEAKGVNVSVREGDNGGMTIKFADVSIHVHGHEWEADWNFPEKRN